MECHKPKKYKKLYQCPCCDYFTLPERDNYIVCPVCFWENEGINVDNLDLESGANQGITLRQGRINFLNFGACDKDMVSNVATDEERKKYYYAPRAL